MTDPYPASRRYVWAPNSVGSSTAPRDNCAGCPSGHVRADSRRRTREDVSKKQHLAMPLSRINLT
jgi:hypothetical protein